MSKDTQFVHGTIVEAEFLNEDQEVATGLVWGLRLAQNAAATVETGVIGDPTDSQSAAIVGGRRVWKNGASTAASGSGAAGPKDIFLSSTEATVPNFEIEVVDDGAYPTAAYYRQVGSADWDGATVLDNITFENGVQADAQQFNQFTFQSISDSNNDTPLTISGYTAQDNTTATLLSIGSDGNQYARFAGTGLLDFTPATATDSVLQASVTGDAVGRFELDANGEMEWGDGALARDTFLSRDASGTLKVYDGTVGGNGILDMVALQNSDTGGAAYNGAGMVNVLDDLNIELGSVLRYDGVQFDSSHLADAADVAHLSGIETFTGAKTFSALQTFTNNVVFSGATAFLNRSGTVAAAATEFLLLSKETADAVHRFTSRVNGTLEWGDGALTRDVQISRTAANELSMGTGDYLKQNYSPTAGEPDVVVNRATLDAALSSGAASKAFSFFIS